MVPVAPISINLIAAPLMTDAWTVLKLRSHRRRCGPTWRRPSAHYAV